MIGCEPAAVVLIRLCSLANLPNHGMSELRSASKGGTYGRAHSLLGRSLLNGHEAGSNILRQAGNGFPNTKGRYGNI